MTKFVRVHPIITKIDKISDAEYLIHETLKFGFLPLNFTYPVSIEKNSVERTVEMNAIVMKLTKIKLIFFITPEDEFTIIEEKISIESILPIKSILQSIFRKQHKILFHNIEREPVNLL
jgi:hypothetical protein